MTQQSTLLQMEDMEAGNTNDYQELENMANLKNNTSHDTVDGRVRKAVPETDEEDDDERQDSNIPGAGVDDGFLPPTEHDIGHKPRKPKVPDFSFPQHDPDWVDINGVRTQVPDVNAYQHKKTLAQGMMDLALLSANANQLRYVLETYKRHPYYYPSLIFISMSIIFQIAVGCGLILNSRYDVRNKQEICRANKISNYTIIGIFIITVVNVFISAFGVADPA